MRVVSLALRDFRSYHDAKATLGSGLTVVSGRNGTGKTNLLEGLYFGCVGRSCRTANEREVVRFGAPASRVVVRSAAEDGPHEITVAFTPGQPKRVRVDGAPVERLVDAATRPLVSVFLPDRLELIKGPPALRRAHLDQFVAALRPARGQTRRLYGQALAQRNALLIRIRAGRVPRDSLSGWDAQLGTLGMELMRHRREAVVSIAECYGRIGSELGFDGDVSISYRPRSPASDPEQLTSELAARLEQDLERGFTGHGPHRDDLAFRLEGRDLREYGSQGQQRLALLALLLSERESLAAERGTAPLMLLDDVMSELDHPRRLALAELLRASAGQSVITTTDLEHIPGAGDADVVRLAVANGSILQEAVLAG